MIIEEESEFAKSWPEMYNQKTRELRALRIIKTLEHFFKKKSLKQMTLLDVGSSTGIIDNYLAKYLKKVTGIDVDESGIKFAKKQFKKPNLKFLLGSGLDLKFKDRSFDIIICTQVYEHVPDPKKLFSEIHRVLKPGGIVYFAAINRLWIIEPHYRLPFLSWFPKKIANIYVKVFGKARCYYESPLSYYGLKNLTNKFKIYDYTNTIVLNPEKFSYPTYLPNNKFIKLLISGLYPISKLFYPAYIWILQKEPR